METQHAATIPTPDILVVDDNIESLRLLTEILTKAGYCVRPANGPQSALDSALGAPPDLILLDVRMPEMDGFELCRRLKQDEHTREIPIIFISALQDTEDRVQGFESGGVDFVSKPFQEAEVLARVKTHLQLRRMQVHLEELVAEQTSELKKTNAALGVSEKKYRTVVEESIEGILIVQDDLRKYYNPALLDMIGYSVEEYKQVPLLSAVHPDDLAAVEQLYRNLISSREFDAVLDFRIITKSGDIKWVSSRSTRIEWESEPASMIFVEDITERRNVEEERNRILTLSQDLICIAGMDGYFKYLNPAWESTLGYRSEELLGRHFLDFIHPDDHTRNDAEMEHLAAGYQTVDFENRYIHKDGSVCYISWTATPLLEKKMLYCIGRNITERKLAEEKVRQYQQRLKALATRLTMSEEEERCRIAADLHDHIGHALVLARMQLQAVSDSSSQLKTDVLVNDISNILLKAIQDTKSLIFDLSVPTMNEIGLAAAISEWLEEYLERRYGLETELIDKSSDCVLESNVRALLFRNVRELFTNVIKHARARHVTIILDDSEECLQICVKDDGIGFDPETIAQNVKPGGGFGLFSIQERMADLGGSLEMLSGPGRGCEIIMRMPFERKTNEGL